MATRQKPGKCRKKDDPRRYLIDRNGWWHYQRRVPERARAFDSRGLIRVGLDTTVFETVAGRDLMERADDLYWAGLAAGGDAKRQLALYESAVDRAKLFGFIYTTAEGLARSASTAELGERIDRSAGVTAQDAEAVLGLVDEPKLTVSGAMDLYLDTIAVDDVRGYSKNPPMFAVDFFLL